MEKSLLSFAATYATWEPDAAAKQMLASLQMQPGPHLHGLPQHAPHFLGEPSFRLTSLAVFYVFLSNGMSSSRLGCQICHGKWHGDQRDAMFVGKCGKMRGLQGGLPSADG